MGSSALIISIRTSSPSQELVFSISSSKIDLALLNFKGGSIETCTGLFAPLHADLGKKLVGVRAMRQDGARPCMLHLDAVVVAEKA